MKTIFFLLTGLFITLVPTRSVAQLFAAGQVNTSYIYSAIGENSPERLFTGVSAEIGAEGPNSSIVLKTGIYIPRKYEFETMIDDGFGLIYFTDAEQRISLYELGLFGRYYLFGEQGNVVRVFTNSGLEMVWARVKEDYVDIYSDILITEKFTNKQLRVGFGLGFEIELEDNIYLLNDFLFKYAFTDMDPEGTMYIDVASDFALNYNVGIKIYL